MIGRRPYFAFGNSTGDRQMLEYTKAGAGVRLAGEGQLPHPVTLKLIVQYNIVELNRSSRLFHICSFV